MEEHRPPPSTSLACLPVEVQSHIFTLCLQHQGSLADMRCSAAAYQQCIDAHVLKNVDMTRLGLVSDSDDESGSESSAEEAAGAAAVAAMRCFLGRIETLEELQTCFDAVVSAAHPTLLSLTWLVDGHSIQPVSAFLSLRRLDLMCSHLLHDIWPLAACVQLQSLIITIVPPDGQQLDLDSEPMYGQLRDVSVVSALPSLTKLSLIKCQVLADIAAIGACSNLVDLDLSHSLLLADISPLSRCRRLASLSLCRNVHSEAYPGVISVAALAGLPLLQTLMLAFCESITNIDALGTCRRLTDLNLRGCIGITCIAALASCTQLSKLIMWNCMLDTIPRLPSSLQDLEIGCCHDHLLPLSMASLVQLRWLKIGCWESLEGIAVLSRLGALTWLEVYAGEALTDLRPLSQCHALVHLRLRGMPLLLQQLAGMRDLQCLSLVSDEEVDCEVDFAPLSACTALQRLALSQFMHKMDLSPLSRCVALRSLVLKDCQGMLHSGSLLPCTQLMSMRTCVCHSLTDTRMLAPGLASCVMTCCDE